MQRHDPQPLPAPTWRAATNIGLREENEDCFGLRHGLTAVPRGDHPVAVVCDGLGGHEDGDIAAQIARNAFLNAYLATKPARGRRVSVPDNLVAAVHAASRAVTRVNAARNGEMGSTLTAAAVTLDGLYWVNVGDSPIFHVSRRTGTCTELGQRHNVNGIPNQLSSVLMAGSETLTLIGVSHGPMPFGENDAFIIASDGIDTIDTQRIAEIAAEAHQDHTTSLADRLVDEVIAREAPRQDNVTVVTLEASSLPTHDEHGGAINGRRFPGEAGEDSIEVAVNGRPLDWRRSLEIRSHNPDGIDWGYAGGGTAQLALALLLELTDGDGATALEHHQQFSDEFIRPIRDDAWTIQTGIVRDWLNDRMER